MIDRENLLLIAKALRTTMPAFDDVEVLMQMRESIKSNLQMVVDWIEEDDAPPRH